MSSEVSGAFTGMKAILSRLLRRLLVGWVLVTLFTISLAHLSLELRNVLELHEPGGWVQQLCFSRWTVFGSIAILSVYGIYWLTKTGRRSSRIVDDRDCALPKVDRIASLFVSGFAEKWLEESKRAKQTQEGTVE